MTVDVVIPCCARESQGHTPDCPEREQLLLIHPNADARLRFLGHVFPRTVVDSEVLVQVQGLTFQGRTVWADPEAGYLLVKCRMPARPEGEMAVAT